VRTSRGCIGSADDLPGYIRLLAGLTGRLFLATNISAAAPAMRTFVMSAVPSSNKVEEKILLQKY
jgi:hypothetical protein